MKRKVHAKEKRRISAKELRAGMIAFLPYFGALEKARVSAVFPARKNHAGQECVRVEYEVLSDAAVNDGYPALTNMCVMRAESQYDAYVSPAGQKEK